MNSTGASLSRYGLICPQNNGQPIVQMRQSGAALRSISANGDKFSIIWKSYYYQQAGYYSNWFYAGNPEGAFASDGAYIGCHPYPDGGGTTPTTHKFEVSHDFTDTVTDDNSNSTVVTKNQWYTHYVTMSVVSGGMQAKFYWDILNSTNKVISTTGSWSTSQTTPCFCMLSTCWESYALQETAYGITRGIQMYNDIPTLADAQIEAANDTSNTPVTAWGIAHVHYMNQNPTPSDITDKSGAGHNFAWLNANRPTLWTG